MLDIAEFNGKETFPGVLCNTLQIMNEPVAEEVKSTFQGNRPLPWFLPHGIITEE